MTKYVDNMCQNFEEKFKVILKAAATPSLDIDAAKKRIDEKARKIKPAEMPGEGELKSKYGQFAASPLMAGLYAARSCRPDLNVAILRLARRITRWTTIDDEM